MRVSISVLPVSISRMRAFLCLTDVRIPRMGARSSWTRVSLLLLRVRIAWIGASLALLPVPLSRMRAILCLTGVRIPLMGVRTSRTRASLPVLRERMPWMHGCVRLKGARVT